MSSRSTRVKKIGPTQYKHVFLYQETIGTKSGKYLYCARVQSLKHISYHQDIHSAAVKVDKVLIENGRQPVNVLKKVEK